MNQSENTQGTIAEDLKAEAETLLRTHFRARHLETMYEAKQAIVAYKASLALRVQYRPPVDSPWIADMMRAAVMPDDTVCMQTLQNHAVNRSGMMTIHTATLSASSSELLNAMELHGCVWNYQEGGDAFEVTGYGLAKFLGIDLHKFMAEERAAIQQAT